MTHLQYFFYLIPKRICRNAKSYFAIVLVGYNCCCQCVIVLKHTWIFHSL